MDVRTSVTEPASDHSLLSTSRPIPRSPLVGLIARRVREPAPGPGECRDPGTSTAARLHDALHRTACLTARGPAVTALWLALRDAVTTRHVRNVVPAGSQRQVRVSADYASVELIAAWEWLLENESRARAMPPPRLLSALRGIATRSSTGSGRAAQADAMRGMTDVPSGALLEFCPLTALEASAS